MVVTAVDVLTKYWPFGQSSFLLCRTVKESHSRFLKITALESLELKAFPNRLRDFLLAVAKCKEHSKRLLAEPYIEHTYR